MSRFPGSAFNLLRSGSILLLLALNACSRGETNTTGIAITSPPVASSTKSEAASTPTAIPPSATPEPLAALVNETGITLVEFQSELALYQASTGTPPTAEEEQRVLNDLIDQVLLAQAAGKEGFLVDENLLQARLDGLVEQLGSQQALTDWIAKNGYTPEGFRAALTRSIAAAWMRDRIIDAVPKTAEQIHARQILLYDAIEANAVFAQLQAGNDFGNLAAKYDPVTGGDLGWFPRGYLPDARLEEVAFSLELNQFSSVIETLAGFHILQVVDRSPDRPLDPDALLALQYRALQEWLETQRSNSTIQILLP